MSKESLHNRDVLNGLCEIISDPAIVLDADGVFVDVIHNAHNGALFFRQPETLLGSDLWDVFSTVQADQFYTVIEDALQAGEQQHIEYHLSLDDGDRYFEARVTPVGSDDTEHVLWLAEDITQRKRREEKQALIERVFEISPVGLVVVEPSGKILFANDRAEDLLGLERGTITGRRYDQPEWNIFYEDGTPVPEAEYPVTRVLESGEPVFGFEHWIELADGTERWLSSNAAPILGDDGTVERVVVGLDDATRLKQREEHLEWLIGTEMLADVGGWELDLETGLIEGTAGMKRLYGLPEYNPTLEEHSSSTIPTIERPFATPSRPVVKPASRWNWKHAARPQKKPSAGSDSGPKRRFATGRRNCEASFATSRRTRSESSGSWS